MLLVPSKTGVSTKRNNHWGAASARSVPFKLKMKREKRKERE